MDAAGQRDRVRVTGRQHRVLGLDGVTQTLTLTLANIPPETVSSERAGNLLLIGITSFTSNTAERLSEAIEAGLAAKPPPVAIAIDLRGNRGGLLRQAITSVALLADHGIIASTAGRNPQASRDWRIDGGDLTHGLPVIVLVDGRTASAAEIMAAALADLSRGVVIGSATLGKGLVQGITRLPDGGELYVTWSRVLAPKGWPIQSLGVMPQICTSNGQEQTSGGNDASTSVPTALEKGVGGIVKNGQSRIEIGRLTAADLAKALALLSTSLTTHALAELAAGKQPIEQALIASRAARAPLPVARALEIRSACPAAEGSESDVTAAHFLADHPTAYRTALLPADS